MAPVSQELEPPTNPGRIKTRPLPVVGIVVPDLRSEQFCDGERRAFDRDHQTIAKPASEIDEVYRWVRARILERLGAPTSAASRATERGAGGSPAIPTTRLPAQPKLEPKAPAPKTSPANSQERRSRRVQVVDVVIGVDAFPDGYAIASQLQSGIATNLSELGTLVALPQPEIRQITNPIRFSVRIFPELGAGIGQKSVSFIVDITKTLDENDGPITQRIATNRKLESRLSIQCPVVFSDPCKVQPAERSRAETALARELLALLRRSGAQGTPRERAAQ